LTRLRDELLGQGNRRIVLVLDDVDRLVDAARATQLIELVQRHRGLHLVVCSTKVHPIETVAAASVTVNTISSRDLMLSIDEVAQLARLLDRSLPSPLLRQLHDATGGWLAVARLILEAMTGADRELPRSAAARYLNQVLINAQAAAGVSPADHDEVLRLSLADHLDDALIGDIWGTDAASGAIARLERSGLVERRYRGDVVVYECPTLIREVLRAACVDRDPVAARAFHARLATWYARRDRRDYDLPALRHAVAAGDWALVNQIWDRHGLGLAAAEPVLVRAIVRDILRPVSDEHPALRVYAASAAPGENRGDGPSVARRHHEHCRRLTNGQLAAMPLADLLYLAGGKLAAARSAAAVPADPDNGDPEDLDALIDRVRIEIATNREAVVLGERVAWFELQVASTAMLAGARDNALRQYQQAVEHAAAASADFVVSRAAAELALVRAMSGEPEVARRWLRQRAGAIEGGRCNPADGQVAAGVAAGLLALDQLDEAAVESELARLDALRR
jgi:ATP/maltotriose-dependent transcriptional regulator MalT